MANLSRLLRDILLTVTSLVIQISKPMVYIKERIVQRNPLSIYPQLSSGEYFWLPFFVKSHAIYSQ